MASEVAMNCARAHVCLCLRLINVCCQLPCPLRQSRVGEEFVCLFVMGHQLTRVVSVGGGEREKEKETKGMRFHSEGT